MLLKLDMSPVRSFGVCVMRAFYIIVKNIFMSNCWQSDQSYHSAIFQSPALSLGAFFITGLHCCSDILFLILNKLFYSSTSNLKIKQVALQESTMNILSIYFVWPVLGLYHNNI